MNIDPGSVEALHNLSECPTRQQSSETIISVLSLMKLDQYQRVKDYLHKYTTIQPDNTQVFCLMAEVLQHTKDTEHAKSW